MKALFFSDFSYSHLHYHIAKMIFPFDLFLLPFDFGFSILHCICVQQCV